jgi:hypothetical protein
MTNIELLKLIRQKIDDVRKECDDLLDSVIEDVFYGVFKFRYLI